MTLRLEARLRRLEDRAVAQTPILKLVRLCFSEADIAAVRREADERGLTDHEVQIIHVVPLQPLRTGAPQHA